MVILGLVSLIPLLSHAAGYVTETSHEVTASVYRAQYTVTTAPPAAIKVYSRVVEYGSQNWNYNASNGPLATISPTSLNNIFAAEFNFSNLGLVSGKKYVYYLAGGTSATSQLLTNPACFTTTGMVSCTSPVSPTNPTNPSSVLDTGSFALEPLDQTNDPDSPGRYVARFSITPNAGITTEVPITLTFKVFTETSTGPVFLKEGSFPSPTVGYVSYPSVDNLDMGTYSGQLYSGTTKVSEEVGFVVGIDPTQPMGPQENPDTNAPVIPFLPGTPSQPAPLDFTGDTTILPMSYSCGTANGSSTPVLTSTSANLCSNSTAVDFNYDGFNYSWKCKSSDGTTKSCVATGGTDTNYGNGFLKNPLAPGLDTFPKIFAAVYNNIILPVAVPFIVLAIMYAGFKFVVARKQGSTDGYSEAKRVLKYTLIGTALLLGGWVIANALQGTLNSLLGPGGIT